MMLVPSAVLVGGRWIKLADLTMEQATAFTQEQALNLLMKGTPFGDIIAGAVKLGIHQERNRFRKHGDV